MRSSASPPAATRVAPTGSLVSAVRVSREERSRPKADKRAERTAKSYFYAECEQMSRRAKEHCARVRGLGRVTNLQHDGVVMILRDGVTMADASARLQA